MSDSQANTCSVNIVLFTNIDQKLQNKLHGAMHYKLGVTCVCTGHGISTVLCCNNTTI